MNSMFRIQKTAKHFLDITRMAPNAIGGHPLWAFVWVTRKCNQFCSHCYVYDNSIPHMDYQLFKRIIHKFEELGIIFVSIFGGEPTLHPQLIDMIKYARLKNRSIYLNTDLTCVKIDYLEEIMKAGVDIISFSLDKAEPANWNKRATSTVDNQLDTILALKAKKYIFTIHCNVTWHKGNLDEGKKLIEYLHEKGDIGISVRPAVYPFPTSKTLEQAKTILLDSEDYERVKDLITWVIEKKRQGYLIINPYTYLENFPNFILGNHRWGCGAFRDILSIDVDGRLIQCSYFLQEVPPPFKPIRGEIQDLTWSRIKESRVTTEHNLNYCNAKCYSPAYFCTAYYRVHWWELLKQYLRT